MRANQLRIRPFSGSPPRGWSPGIVDGTGISQEQLEAGLEMGM